MFMFRVYFLTTLDIYKAYFEEPSHMDTETKSWILLVWNYCVYTP